MNDTEKIKSVFDTFKSFCDQFGNDEYSKIFLEVLFEEIYAQKDLSLPSEERPEGNNLINNPKVPPNGDKKI